MILTGDAGETLRMLASESVQTCITSPPYFGLRDYGVAGQIGLETTPEAYVAKLVSVFREVKRVLRDDGTLWLNLGDSYTSGGRAGHGASVGEKQATNRGANVETAPARAPLPIGLKPKDLVGIPWMVAFALRADGWYLRSDIIWHKPNPMPESVTDRPTKAHEYLFLLAKSTKYFYDAEAVKEPAVHGERYHGAYDHRSDGLNSRNGRSDPQNTTLPRNRRSVWTVTTKPYRGAHFATFPPDLIRPCVLAGAPAGGVVLDPFCGSGTVGQVCAEEGREFIGIELNPAYVKLAEARIASVGSLFHSEGKVRWELRAAREARP